MTYNNLGHVQLLKFVVVNFFGHVQLLTIIIVKKFWSCSNQNSVIFKQIKIVEFIKTSVELKKITMKN